MEGKEGGGERPAETQSQNPGHLGVAALCWLRLERNIRRAELLLNLRHRLLHVLRVRLRRRLRVLRLRLEPALLLRGSVAAVQELDVVGPNLKRLALLPVGARVFLDHNAPRNENQRAFPDVLTNKRGLLIPSVAIEKRRFLTVARAFVDGDGELRNRSAPDASRFRVARNVSDDVNLI